MKKIAALTIILAFVILAAPSLFAQEERGEVNVFADYIRFRNTGNTNFWGPGANLAFNLNNYAAFEAGMAYDLEKTIVHFDPLTSTTTSAGLRLWHGEFGPKFQTGFHTAKLYLALKGGFLHFSTNGSFTGTVPAFFNGDTNGVFYPAVGVEFGKRFGIRIEAGDMMYFDNGANNNLRITIGPKISF